MTKQKEDENFIWYQLEVRAKIGTYIDKRGRTLPKFKPLYGIFKFNKKEDLKEKSIELIKEKTDPLLIGNNILLIKCLTKMNECKRKKSFPSIVHYAAG